MTDVVFRKADHTYWLGDRQVPNVTSILDRFAQDYAGIPEWILEPARDRGRAVHLVTAYDDQGVLVEDALHPYLVPYLQAWRRFRHDTKFESILIEEKVFSERYFYAGTLDRVGLLDGSKVVLDIKTGNALRATVGPQCAAYEEALRTDRRKKPSTA